MKVAVPQTHEMFIKYCSDCVGVMSFIRQWNSQVEASLGLTAEGEKMQSEINRLKGTINDLNTLIADQEKRMIVAEHKYDELHKSAKFIEQWGYQQDMRDREGKLALDVRTAHERVLMCGADMEGKDARLLYQSEAQEEEWETKNAALRHETSEMAEALQCENRARIDMLEKLGVSESANASHRERIASLEADNASQKSVIASLREQLALSKKRYEDESEALIKKTHEHSDLADTSKYTIRNLTAENEKLQAEIEMKDKQIDHVYTEMREVRNDKDAVMEEFLQLRADEAERVQVARLEAERLARKPRFSLRAVAHSVQLCVRIKNLILFRREEEARALLEQHDDDLKDSDVRRLKALGEIGNRIWITHLTASTNRLKDARDTLQEHKDRLEHELAESQASDEKRGYRIKMLMDNVNTEKKKVMEAKGEYEEQVNIVSERDKTIDILKEQDRRRITKINECARVIKRAEFGLHLQRTVIRQYAHNASKVAVRLQSLNPEMVSEGGVDAGWGFDKSLYGVVRWKRPPPEVPSPPSDDAAAVTGSKSRKSFREDGSIASSRSGSNGGSRAVAVTSPAPTAPAPTDMNDGGDDGLFPTMSNVRRQEVYFKLYTSFKGLSDFLRKSYTRMPCTPSLKLVPEAHKIIAPLDTATVKFDDKYAALGKLYVDSYRADAARMDEQQTTLLDMSSQLDSFAARERGRIMKLSIKVSEQVDHIARLETVVKEWEKKERKRQRAEAKKLQKESAKKEKRAAKLEATKSRRVGFSVKGGGLGLDVNDLKALQDMHGGGGSQDSLASGSIEEAGDAVDGGGIKSVDAFTARLQVAAKATSVSRAQSLAALPSMGAAPSEKKTIEKADLSFLDEPERVMPVSAAKVSSQTAAVVVVKPKNDAGEGEGKGDDETISLDSSEEEEQASSDDSSSGGDDEEIEMLMETVDELTEETVQLKKSLVEKDAEIATLNGKVEEDTLSISKLSRDYKVAQLDYEAAIARIRVLRDAVEDNYRERQTELRKMKKQIRERDKTKEERRVGKLRDASTNIVCSVCAIRGWTPGTGAGGFAADGRDRGSGRSAAFAETDPFLAARATTGTTAQHQHRGSSKAMHNEDDSLSSRSAVFSEEDRGGALGGADRMLGEYELCARPRNINKLRDRQLQQQRLQEQGQKQHRHQLKQQRKREEEEAARAGGGPIPMDDEDTYREEEEQQQEQQQQDVQNQTQSVSAWSADPHPLWDSHAAHSSVNEQNLNQNQNQGDDTAVNKSKFRAINRIPAGHPPPQQQQAAPASVQAPLPTGDAAADRKAQKAYASEQFARQEYYLRAHSQVGLERQLAKALAGMRGENSSSGDKKQQPPKIVHKQAVFAKKADDLKRTTQGSATAQRAVLDQYTAVGEGGNSARGRPSSSSSSSASQSMAKGGVSWSALESRPLSASGAHAASLKRSASAGGANSNNNYHPIAEENSSDSVSRGGGIARLSATLRKGDSVVQVSQRTRIGGMSAPEENWDMHGGEFALASSAGESDHHAMLMTDDGMAMITPMVPHSVTMAAPSVPPSVIRVPSTNIKSNTD
jgi:hypothetical protein